MLLKPATDIAIKNCELLQPHCYNVNIAGSVRRRVAEPGDIEIICRPLREATGQASMFAEVAAEVAVVKKFADAVHSLGEVLMGNVNGRQMKIMLPEGIKLDLFIPQDHDYYRQYAIRTGSATYAHITLAHAWTQKGWVGTDQGLRRREDCQQVGENKYKVINPDGLKPPMWEDEPTFFAWLGVDYIDPRLRDVQSVASFHQHKKLLK